MIVFHDTKAQYYFGQNKIQYNKFDWHVLKTEHFDIYYYPQMKELAEIGAAHAEKVYTLLENKFNHNINVQIPLILYSTQAHFQESNTIPYMLPENVGGFFEFLKGRVVIPANGSISDFKNVLQHELVHVFTNSKVNQVFRDHNLFNHPGLPLWFTEGIAEYWSIDWDSQTEMFMRDAVLNNYVFLPSRFYQIAGSFLMYKEGQALVKYIAETYGEEKLFMLMENIWMGKQFSDVLRLTIGKSYKDLDKEWEYTLKKQFYPLLEDNESVRMTTQQLTKKGFNIKPAYYEKENERNIVFISTRTGYANIYLKPLTNAEADVKSQVLVAGGRTSDFESFHLLNSNIDVNSSGRLVFVSKSGERDQLYIYDIKTGTITEKYHFENLVSLFSPAWSPTENRIVFSGLAFSGKSDLYVFDLTQQKLTRLTNDYYDDKDPAWSPGGNKIAFSSDRGQTGENGCYNLFLFDLNTGRISYLTCGEYNDNTPSWSPDGRFLAFSSDRSETPNIWVLKVDGKQPMIANAEQDFRISKDQLLNNKLTFLQNNDYTLKQITHFTTGAFDPEWTGNGGLLFSAFEKFSFQIHLLEDINHLFDKNNAVENDKIASSMKPWEFERLLGEKSGSGKKYKPKFSLDIAQSQITQDPIFGTSGGAQLAVSDMLGNYQYFFLLYNTARTQSEFLGSFNIAVSRVDLSHRTNFATGLYHFSGRFYNFYDLWYWERRYGGFGAISYPLTKFQRIEASLNFRFSDKDWYLRNYRRKALLVSNFVSYIKDNSLWGPTGPIDGERINITLGNTTDIAHSNVNFATTILDYRRYFRLSTSVTHAVRFWTEINYGKESPPFFMGGSWDLRGYRFWRIWGTKLAFMSNELRFPFIDQFVVNFPFGGLAFSSLRGALFIDVGNAWDKDLDHMLGSMGFGTRFRLGIMVIRFDVGRKFIINHPDKFYVRSNYEFEKKWFTQFFFGWDF